jgi:hypothetical protein
MPALNINSLRLDPQGNLDAIKYFTWKFRLMNDIKNMRLNSEQILHLLLTKTNILPEKLRVNLQNSGSLDQLLNRLEVQCPPLGAALPLLLRQITSLPHCGNEGYQIESRCTQLLTSIEELRLLFPTHTLDRQEVMATMSMIGPHTISQISQVEAFSKLALRGEQTMIASLYEFLQTLRTSYVELRTAQALYHNNTQKRSLAFTSSKPSPSPKTNSTTDNSINRKGQKASDHSNTECSVCGNKHKQIYHNCPKLRDIAANNSTLRKECCNKCLGFRSKLGQCLKQQPCNFYQNNGQPMSLLCRTHGLVHFKLCNKCPPYIPQPL